MKNHILLTFAAICAIAVAPAIAQSAAETKPAPTSSPVAQKYTCEMHPEVISDKPGKCPKCGMKLIPVQAPAAPTK